MIIHQLVGFKAGECTRHICKGDEEIINHLLYKDYTVYRPDTNQVAVLIVEGAVAWVDVTSNPTPYKHNHQRQTMLDMVDVKSL